MTRVNPSSPVLFCLVWGFFLRQWKGGFFFILKPTDMFFTSNSSLLSFYFCLTSYLSPISIQDLIPHVSHLVYQDPRYLITYRRARL